MHNTRYYLNSEYFVTPASNMPTECSDVFSSRNVFWRRRCWGRKLNYDFIQRRCLYRLCLPETSRRTRQVDYRHLLWRGNVDLHINGGYRCGPVVVYDVFLTIAFSLRGGASDPMKHWSSSPLSFRALQTETTRTRWRIRSNWSQRCSKKACPCRRAWLTDALCVVLFACQHSYTHKVINIIVLFVLERWHSMSHICPASRRSMLLV